MNSKSSNKNITLDAFVKLMRCAESIRHNSHSHLQQYGVTESQLAVLEALYHKGEMTQKHISEKILKSKSNMTTVLVNMEKSGLIKRKQDPSDKRYTLISLSLKGDKVIRNIFPQHIREIEKAMAALSTNEKKQLAALCKKLGRSL